jgi:hypothetical protein
MPSRPDRKSKKLDGMQLKAANLKIPDALRFSDTLLERSVHDCEHGFTSLPFALARRIVPSQ